jgi:hypothetical protein
MFIPLVDRFLHLPRNLKFIIVVVCAFLGGRLINWVNRFEYKGHFHWQYKPDPNSGFPLWRRK